MKRSIYLPLAVIAIIAASCNTPESTSESESAAAGNKKYGGTFRFNMTEQFDTWNTLGMNTVSSIIVARQIYDGLVSIHPVTLELEPGIAESWSTSEDGMVYTFHLRKDVFFHDNPCFEGGKGRNVKASDVWYSFKRLATPGKTNGYFSQILKGKVRGADAFHESFTKDSAEVAFDGIEVIDDYQIRITLTKRVPNFLYMLTQPGAYIVAKEAIEKYGDEAKVGSGPFRFAKEEEFPRKIFMVKNDHYYKKDSLGNQLPFLDSVVVYFLTTKEGELSEFMGEHLDMAFELPAKSVKDLVQSDVNAFQGNPPKYVLQSVPNYVTQYYSLNLNNPFLANKKVRKAIAYAINKEKVVKEVLMDQAWGPATNGMTPPNIPGYDISRFKGITYNPDTARQLLAQAGYPGGKGTPKLKLELNSGGARHALVAFEIVKQLETDLNLQVEWEVVPFPKKFEDEKYGRGDIFRSGWIADYPSPEAFLFLFSHFFKVHL